MSNPLRDCGKPLFFRVENAAELGLGPPAPRLGEALRLGVRSLSLMQKEALVASARTGAVWRFASDEGAYLAGQDEAPCPLAFLSTGMVSSYLHEILALATQRKLPITKLRLVQDNYYTMQGSALKGTMRGGAEDVHLTAQIESPAAREVLTTLICDATLASPMNGLLHESLQSLFTLTHNGRSLEPREARPLGAPAERDCAAGFAQARPAVGDWQALVERGGATPKAEHTVTLANDSLAEQQNRLLHLRVICERDDNGVKRIEQRLYNPQGSVFRLLCDEAPVNGGRGLAPDAASYVSAGIGFCFMTQFGRYAKIVKKDLRAYRIVQDTHFSLGGASAATGRAGRAEPVETHVYLDSGEDDDFARTALDMAEQTCFLHALCKAQLKTRVAIEPYSATALPAVRALPA